MVRMVGQCSLIKFCGDWLDSGSVTGVPSGIRPWSFCEKSGGRMLPFSAADPPLCTTLPVIAM
jgi:hypothetical protein